MRKVNEYEVAPREDLNTTAARMCARAADSAEPVVALFNGIWLIADNRSIPRMLVAYYAAEAERRQGFDVLIEGAIEKLQGAARVATPR